MLRQRHEAQFACPMTTTFAAVLAALGRGRWGASSCLELSQLPLVGCVYVQQRGKVLRRGKVVECLRPVAITLQETLLDPPCCVKLRLRWRLEPLDCASFARLDVRYSLNGAASIRAKHWRSRIDRHCGNLLQAVQTPLDETDRAQRAATKTKGQNTGNSTIAATKMIKVNGKPSFR